ncbi:nucleoporin GLE1-like [Helianthus annuus]|uniref:nucleoporin GLE1-like n=1 Tax=Helianthus annuus TaxID=4232 RepID=UPI000B902FCD|nr:nucleoporin GLE1-like [Helianthus annuus]
MILKNNGEFANLSLSKFIEKLEVQEMEQRKMEKMKNSNGEQDVGLYYKGSTSDKTNIAPKIETAFNTNSSSGGSSQGSNNNNRFSSYLSFDPKFSATKNVAPHQQQAPQTSHARKDLIEEPSKKAYLVHQEDERIPQGFNWDHYDPNRTSESKAFVAQIYEDSSAEDEMAYAYYESQQYSPKRKKKNKFQQKRDNLYFAGKMEEIKPEENVQVIKKQVKETPAIKVEKEANTEKISKKIYPTVEGMEAFEEKKPEVKNTGTSSEEETKSLFWKQSNKEFLAEKQKFEKIVFEANQKKERRTCYQCQKVEHIAWNCPKSTQTKQEKFAEIQMLLDHHFEEAEQKHLDFQKMFLAKYKKIISLENEINLVKKELALTQITAQQEKEEVMEGNKEAWKQKLEELDDEEEAEEVLAIEAGSRGQKDQVEGAAV